MAFRWPQHMPSKILEEVNILTYLGYVSYLENEDIDNKIIKFKKMNGIRRNLKNKAQRWTQKFYNTMVVPIPMYGPDMWALMGNKKKQLKVTEMHFLRSVVEMPSREHTKNVDNNRIHT